MEKAVQSAESSAAFEEVRRHFNTHDTFAVHLGIEMTEIGPGRARAVMPLEAAQKNGVGLAHGGALFALADIAFGGACNSSGETALGVSSSIRYLKGGKVGPLSAEACEISRSRKLGHYEIRVFDGNGELLSVCQATAYFRGDRLAAGAK
jgi:acyl-CoA thioesterase